LIGEAECREPDLCGKAGVVDRIGARAADWIRRAALVFAPSGRVGLVGADAGELAAGGGKLVERAGRHLDRVAAVERLTPELLRQLREAAGEAMEVAGRNRPAAPPPGAAPQPRPPPPPR